MAQHNKHVTLCELASWLTNTKTEMFSVYAGNARSSCLVVGSVAGCSTHAGLQHWNFDPRNRCVFRRCVNTMLLITEGFDRMKSRAPALRREPYDDPMESCRKHCANWFYDCCCQREPKCSRITCSICFVCCCCCSLFDVVWSFCVMKLRVCSVPCCGRPIVPATSLVVRTVVKEVIVITVNCYT